MTFEIGRTVGGYEFLDILDSSKTGVAYKVRNVKYGRVEMLRILPRSVQDDQERVERFLREVKVHGRLSHPNIITFFNATEIEGQLVMTMELVEGTPLAFRLESGSIHYLEAIYYVRQILSALGYAHKEGIVHRDVTPANILVTPDNRAMLGGFGMAKAATDPNLTQTGTAVGVAQYMSPEQVKGVATLDGRSDLYSLGVVLYQAITGKVPFQANSQFEVMLAHVNSAPKAPSLITPGIPAELDKIILTALAKDPSQRFQTANEFSTALAEVKLAAKDKAAEKSGPWLVEVPKLREEVARVVSPPSPAPVRAAAASAQPDQAKVKSVTFLPKLATTPTKDTRAKEWTFAELALSGVVTSIILTVVFLVLMTMTGLLPLVAGH
jgi:serine/threonine-protein kinase